MNIPNKPELLANSVCLNHCMEAQLRMSKLVYNQLIDEVGGKWHHSGFLHWSQVRPYRIFNILNMPTLVVLRFNEHKI